MLVSNTVLEISFCYIDIDEKPGFFLFLKLDFFVTRSEDTIFIELLHVKIFMLSWLQTCIISTF